MTDAERPTVLVVDDEPEAVDATVLRLRGTYDTAAAYSGAEALDRLDDEVDVVLLDRRMPELSGDEVLREIRDGEHDPRVIMVTAIDPGFDIVDMPFDDYLCKPVDKESLLTAVEQQLRSVTYARLSEYFELASKRSVLEAQLPPNSLETDERYAELVARTDALRSELEDAVEGFEGVERAFETVDRDPR
jgi:CheY-like chemotaxis protein